MHCHEMARQVQFVPGRSSTFVGSASRITGFRRHVDVAMDVVAGRE